MRKNHNIFVIYALNIIIYLFALCYPHMDSRMFWFDVFEYFSASSLGNQFIISTELGLMWLAIPICALMGVEDSAARRRYLKEGSYRNYTVHVCKNICIRVILPFVMAIGIFCFVLGTTSCAEKTGSWQITAINNAYQWRAENEFIWVYILEFIARVCMALVFWSMIGVTLLFVMEQKAEVSIYLIIINMLINIFFSHIGRRELSIANLEIPSVSGLYPLKDVTKGLMIYLAIGVMIYMILGRIIQKAYQTKEYEEQRKNTRMMSDKVIYMCCQGFSIWNLILLIFMPIIINAVYNGRMCRVDSVLDAWLNYFGGLGWGTPEVNPYQVLVWILSLSPIMIGVSRIYGVWSTQRYKLKIRSILAVYGASVAYTVLGLVIEVLIVSMMAILSGTTRFFMTYSPEGISQIELGVCLLSIPLISLICKTTLLIAILLIGGRKELAISTVIIPNYLMLLLGSNEDVLTNVYLPANWEMILRSDIFSPTSIMEYVSENVLKEYQLASFSLRWELKSLLLLCVVSILFFVVAALIKLLCNNRIQRRND